MIGHPWRPFTTRDGDVACADCYLAEQHRIHKAADHGTDIYARVAERCPQCENERLRALVLAMAEKIFLMARHLGRLAEREEFRNGSLTNYSVKSSIPASQPNVHS